MADEQEGLKPEEKFDESVTKLVESISRSGEKIREATAAATAPPAPVAPQKPALTEERLNEVAAEHGVGQAMKVFAEEAMLPLQMHNYDVAAKQAKKIAFQDPELGAWAKSHSKQIDEHVKSQGITSQYLAENGYEGVVHSLRDQDPAVRQAEIQTEAERIANEMLEARGVTAPAPKTVAAVSRPGLPPTPGSPPPNLTPQQTREQAISAIEVSQADIDFQKKYFKMSPAEAKKQRYERLELEKKHGEHGLKAIGGYPICSLADLGIPEN